MANTKFNKDHIWARLEDDGDITIGITEYAQDELGDIVFIEQPQKGSTIKIGGKSMVIESVKSASDIPSPLSGRVVATNDAATKDPSIINHDPEQNGWLFKIHPSDMKEFDKLLDKEAYEKYLHEG
jgi:glycine cleavage system H protein